MSSSNSPCAACKIRRQKCTQECVLAPYFPPDQPQKFVNVHKVFGASNVTKLLNELNAANREDAVNSLAYEAEARLRDPVYGCVGLISILQQKLKQVQSDLLAAKKELAAYIGPSAMLPVIQHGGYMPQTYISDPHSSSVMPYNMSPILGLPHGVSHSGQLVIPEPQSQQSQQYQQQIFEAQQLATAMAVRGQEMMRTHEQQQRQEQELIRFDRGFDGDGVVSAASSSFNQMTEAAMSASLGLGTFDNAYQLQEQQQEHQLEPQLMALTQKLPQQQQQPQLSHRQQGFGSEEASSVGPSC